MLSDCKAFFSPFRFVTLACGMHYNSLAGCPAGYANRSTSYEPQFLVECNVKGSVKEFNFGVLLIWTFCFTKNTLHRRSFFIHFVELICKFDFMVVFRIDSMQIFNHFGIIILHSVTQQRRFRVSLILVIDYWGCTFLCFFDILTYFQSMFHVCIFWKHQKTSGFLVISGDTEVKHWLKMS